MALPPIDWIDRTTSSCRAFTARPDTAIIGCSPRASAASASLRLAAAPMPLLRALSRTLIAPSPCIFPAGILSRPDKSRQLHPDAFRSTSTHTDDRELPPDCSMVPGASLNPGALKLLSEIPTLCTEITHRLREYFKGVLFANDFEHDVVHPDCFFDCFTQPRPLDHTRK